VAKVAEIALPVFSPPRLGVQQLRHEDILAGQLALGEKVSSALRRKLSDPFARQIFRSLDAARRVAVDGRVPENTDGVNGKSDGTFRRHSTDAGSLMLKTLDSKGMVARQRSTDDFRVKSIEVTAGGLKALSRAFPIAIKIQRRMFGEEGCVGGSLLTALLRIDRLRED
jgi:hypothetical protein